MNKFKILKLWYLLVVLLILIVPVAMLGDTCWTGEKYEHFVWVDDNDGSYSALLNDNTPVEVLPIDTFNKEGIPIVLYYCIY